MMTSIMVKKNLDQSKNGSIIDIQHSSSNSEYRFVSYRVLGLARLVGVTLFDLLE